MCVVFALSGKIRIDLDDMAHIHNQQEGPVAMVDGKRPGITHGLLLRRHHDVVPHRIFGGLAFFRGGIAKQADLVRGLLLLFPLLLPFLGLFGFQNEMSARSLPPEPDASATSD